MYMPQCPPTQAGPSLPVNWLKVSGTTVITNSRRTGYKNLTDPSTTFEGINGGTGETEEPFQ